MVNALACPRLQRVVSLIDEAGEALGHPLLKAGFRTHIFEFLPRINLRWTENGQRPLGLCFVST